MIYSFVFDTIYTFSFMRLSTKCIYKFFKQNPKNIKIKEKTQSHFQNKKKLRKKTTEKSITKNTKSRKRDDRKK